MPAQESAPEARRVEDVLLDFIQRELAPESARAPIAARQALFESVLDSTNVLSLVSYIEITFAIRVDDLEITPGNFATLERTAAFIARKRTARAEGLADAAAADYSDQKVLSAE